MLLYIIGAIIVMLTNVCTAIYCYRAGVAKYRTANGSNATIDTGLANVEQATDAAVSTGTAAHQTIQDVIDGIRRRDNRSSGNDSSNGGN